MRHLSILPLAMVVRWFVLSIAWWCVSAAVSLGDEAVNESARAIPVAYQVDVVVVGGGTGAVAAAIEAAASGAKVFLAAERPYLGDDMTATLRLWPQPGDELESALAEQIFYDPQRKLPSPKSVAASVPLTMDLPPRPLHVKKTLDNALLAVGGGTSGAPAAIASARQGVKTLLVEQHHGLGGMGTLGAVAGYFFGNRCGFTATVGGGDKWVIEQKMQWWRDEFLKAGGELWFGCIGCGAFVHKGRVCGVVVATPRGRGVVLAKAVVDTTGNADIAAAAGAECLYTDHRDFAMLGAGVPPRDLGATEGGADDSIVDETDMVDVWHLYVYAKDKHPKAFDQGPIIDTRERRRIVGDHMLTIVDEMNERTYPDTIAVATSTYDLGPTECYPIDPVMLAEKYPKQCQVNIPYRCCLPKGLDAIFVAALGLSADHDAMPMIRMQPDLQNLGYAVGVAAAMTARSGLPARQIDLRALQRHLVEIGNVPTRVLTDGDSYPLRAQVVIDAVRNLDADFYGASVILAERQQSMPLLRKAYASSEGPARLIYARMLGILGDPMGVETLIAATREYSQWDVGWSFRLGRGRSILQSPLDCLIITLGRTRDRRALPAIVEKLKLLTADDDFSHHRAVALALESLADPAAAKPLAELLAQPQMSGHVRNSIEVASQHEREAGKNGVKCRRESLRELMLARALCHCGDYEGVGQKTLGRYAEDLRGHLSRHARAVLDTYRPAH